MRHLRIIVPLMLFVGSIAVAQQTTPVAPPDRPQVFSQPIGEPALTVAANSFKEYPFTIPAGLRTIRLVGHFTATGGAHNDIVLCVMNDDQFVNWRNGGADAGNNPIKVSFAGALYDSHIVTQGTIKLYLPSDPATYHVVFYNGFSYLTPKAVAANLALQYTRQ
jgi:hypothetical protein